MQFTIIKRKIDAKIKASLLICLFLSWSMFTLRDSISYTHIMNMIIFSFIIILVIHPYLLILFTSLRFNLWNSRITDYEYIEFGENGLYFRYPDLDLRIDTNISEIKIKKRGYDYIYSFGNNREFLIPTEKPFEWIGDDKLSFMFVAKTLAKNHALGISVKTEGAWKMKNVKQDILKNNKIYNTSYREANLEFSTLSLDKNFLTIESKNDKSNSIKIEMQNLSFIYEIQSPKTNYWLNILRYYDRYLVLSFEKKWFISKI